MHMYFTATRTVRTRHKMKLTVSFYFLTTCTFYQSSAFSSPRSKRGIGPVGCPVLAFPSMPSFSVVGESREATGVRKDMMGFLGRSRFLERRCCLSSPEASSGSSTQSHRLHALLLLSVSPLELPRIVVPWGFCAPGTPQMLNANG